MADPADQINELKREIERLRTVVIAHKALVEELPANAAIFRNVLTLTEGELAEAEEELRKLETP